MVSKPSIGFKIKADGKVYRRNIWNISRIERLSSTQRLSPRGNFETTSNHFADTSKVGFMNNERRNFVRNPIKHHSIFLYSNYSPVKGWVKDISKGGMSFEYILLEECEPKSEISVILTGETLPFYLPDIHCKTIYNIKANKNDRSYRGTVKRCCGVQYVKLDPKMQEKIEFLLNSEIILPGM